MDTSRTDTSRVDTHRVDAQRVDTSGADASQLNAPRPDAEPLDTSRMTRRLRLAARTARKLPNVVDLSPAELEVRRRGLPGPLMAALTGAAARGVSIGDRVLQTEAGPVRTRLYLPKDVAASLRAQPRSSFPLVVHAHGGGFVLGRAQDSDWLCSRVAAGVGGLLVSVDYRLAPEHPAPAGADDYWAVLRHLLAGHAPALPIDPARVALMGDSAGGTFAALAAQRHRDALADGDTTLPDAPLRHQVLIYPGTDLTNASPSIWVRANAPILPKAHLDAFLTLYFRDSDLRPDDPRVSPLLALDVHDVAPALIVTSDLDPLQDDGIRYAERLRQAGVPVREISYPDVPHGFMSMSGLTPVARRALDELVGELRRALG